MSPTREAPAVTPPASREREAAAATARSGRLPVGILGATGAVGQRLVAHLADHPTFEVTRLMASDRSAGRRYGDACAWRLPGAIPGSLAELEVTTAAPDDDVVVVFSGIGATPARVLEPAWAQAGAWVFSNASAHRMDADVPLLIPEVNPGHLDLVRVQRDARSWPGAIVTNANCSTTFLALALAPLHEAFTVEAVFVSTLQAVSGAGYRGVASMEILGNVIPHIPGEEEKMERETRKILGALTGTSVSHAPFPVSAHASRVPVLDGHTLTVSVRLSAPVSPEEAAGVLDAFSGDPQRLGLPSAPRKPLVVMREDGRPQPALDAYLDRGMAVSVGRIRRCPVLDLRMVVMGHNTIRGAGPGSVLNAELALATGRLEAPA